MQAVLLAAGRSNRFWPLSNGDHKSVYAMAGKPLLIHTLESLAKTGLIEEAFIVHAPHFSVPHIVPQSIGAMRIVCKQQDEPKGTGDALYRVSEYIRGDFVLVWPDMVNADFFVRSLVRAAQQRGVQAAMLGAPTKAPWNFGIVRKDGDLVREIVEKPASGSEPSLIKRIGVELLPKELLSFYESLPRHHETDLVDALNAYAEKHDILLVEQQHDVPVLKYPWDIATIMNIMTRSFASYARKNPATNEQVVLSKQSVVQNGCVFGRDVVLRGPVYVGNGSVIGDGTHIIGPTTLEENTIIGNECKIVRSSVGRNTTVHDRTSMEDSIIAPECRIGRECIIQGQKGDRSVIEVYGQDGQRIITGRRQLGVVMGRGAVVGNECYTEPGVLLDSECVIEDKKRVSYSEIDHRKKIYAP